MDPKPTYPPLPPGQHKVRTVSVSPPTETEPLTMVVEMVDRPGEKYTIKLGRFLSPSEVHPQFRPSGD